MRCLRIGTSLFALAMLVSPLAGCSTAGFGVPGAFGPGPSPIAGADVADPGNPVAQQALADARGQDALVRLYLAVSRGRDFDTQLSKEFGLTADQLTRRWQQRLRQLAAAAPA